jgi:hypothetical protein
MLYVAKPVLSSIGCCDICRIFMTIEDSQLLGCRDGPDLLYVYGLGLGLSLDYRESSKLQGGVYLYSVLLTKTLPV